MILGLQPRKKLPTFLVIVFYLINHVVQYSTSVVFHFPAFPPMTTSPQIKLYCVGNSRPCWVSHFISDVRVYLGLPSSFYYILSFVVDVYWYVITKQCVLEALILKYTTLLFGK